MMQIVKHKKEPRKAMILSKAGKIMARMTMRATVKMRTSTRTTRWTPSFRAPEVLSVDALTVPTPQRTSKVATKGRALCSC